MTVLYDYQIFTAQKFGGISRYFVDLMKGIELIHGCAVSLEVVGNLNYYLPLKYYGNFSFPERFRKYHKRSNKIEYKNKAITLNRLKNDQIDVFHPTYYDPYFIEEINKPLVVTVHDMIYENFPDLFHPNEPTAYHKRLHMQKADKIIAVSQRTKDDILKFYPAFENKVEVVYHGLDMSAALEYDEVTDLPERYILYVGARSGYKNFSLLLQAFSSVSKTDTDLKLIVAGHPFGIAEQEIIYRNGIQNSVLHIGATDNQLNTLYKKAIFFIYPSTYEGFGLPILEAFHNQCPVLLSDASCFPEIAGDAAAYFETFSVESLQEKIEFLLGSATERTSLIKLGNERLKSYSMSACVTNTVQLYKSLV